jgi:hypothetical protein
MHLELSAPIDQILLHPPILNTTNKTAASKITDANDQPITLKIYTTLNEVVHSSKTRAYVDLALEDQSCLDVVQQLNDHVIQYVIDHHSTPEWFNKDIPEHMIVNFFEPFIEVQKSRDHPFLRLKASCKDQSPLIKLITVSGEDSTESTVPSLDTLTGKNVCYEVLLEPVRFLEQSFRTSLKLVSIHYELSSTDMDLTELILNNDTHRDKKENIQQIRAEMEKQRIELNQLELLKKEVEEEVAAVLTRRDDVNRKYQETLAQIQKMEEQNSIDAEDHDEVYINEDDTDNDESDEELFENIENMEGLVDTPFEDLAEGTVTVEADEIDADLTQDDEVKGEVVAELDAATVEAEANKDTEAHEEKDGTESVPQEVSATVEA